MSCYFRHLKDIFAAAGIEVTASNEKQIDQTIHNLVRVSYKDCPTAWKRLKREIISDEQKRHDFVDKLQKAIVERTR